MHEITLTEPHGYEVDGIPVPSVTQIMRDLEIINYDHINPGVLDHAMERGTTVHSATQYIDEDDMDWDSLDPQLVPYIRAYEKFKVDSGFEPKLIEYPVYHPLQQYAGTIDRIGVLNDKHVQIDFKTGSPPKWSGLQTAAYEMAYQHTEWKQSRQIQRRFVLQLSNDGSYNLHPCGNRADYMDFPALVRTYYIKNNIKRRSLTS